MKKVICILISFLLTVCLIGCDKNKTDDGTFQTKETSGEEIQTSEKAETSDGNQTDNGDVTADSETADTDSSEPTDDTDENNGWTNIY